MELGIRSAKHLIGVVFACVIACTSVVPAQAATLDAVRARGHLVCGEANPLVGFSQKNGKGLWSGFDVDICRAIAAAVFGDPNKVEFRALDGDSRFAQLQNGDIDVMVRNGAWTIRRDSDYGAHFVAPSFYDGQAFMVPQALGFVSAYELDDVAVCVLDGGDQIINMREFFFETQATYTEVTYEDREDLSVAYKSGMCNAVSAPASWLYGIKRSMPDPANHRILPERITREPLGPYVREGDDQWFDIVKWTLYTLIDAEELGVTQRNLDSIGSSRNPSIRRILGLEDNFGKSLGLQRDWMRNVIKAVGNYGEIFDRNFGPQTGAALLRGLNALWTKGGLMFAPPIR